MNFYKLTALMIVLVILLSACEPVLQRTDLQIEETQDNPATEPSPTTIAVSEPQTMSQNIHGFGMGSSTNLRVPDIDQAYREMADMGVRYMREEIPMADVQIGEDFYDFNARWDIDRMIPAASKYGLKIVGLLAYGPSLPYDDDEHFLRLWEGYVRAVVDRYGENIDYWEIGNEMNSLQFWNKVRKGASLVEVNIYAAMLTSAYQIIKANDPGDTVIVGGLINDADFTQGYSPLSFLYALEKFCTTTCFDAIGLHTYWGADLPETPRRQLLTGFYEELTMPEYVHFFSKEVARIFNQPIPIWITEVGYNDTWINELSMKINLPAPVLQAALLSRVYVSLLSVPTVEIVFWYAYVDTDPNQNYTLMAESKAVYETLSEAISNAIPLGRFPIESDTGDLLHNLYDYRFMMANGDTTSFYWSKDNQFDTSVATITQLVESPAIKHQINSGFNVPGMLVDQDFTKLSILQRPEIIIGKMDENTQLIVQTKQVEDINNLEGQVAYVSGGDIFIHDLAEGSNTRITSSQTNHSPDWSFDGQYLLYIHGSTENANLIVLDSDWNEISVIPARAGRWAWNTHDIFWISQNHDRFIRTDIYGNDPSEVFDMSLAPGSEIWDDFTVGTHNGVIVSMQYERGILIEGYFRQLFKGWESFWETYQAPEYQGQIPEFCMFSLEESKSTGDWAFVINTDCMRFPGWNMDIIFASGRYLEAPGSDPAWSPDGKYLTFRYMQRCDGPGMCNGGIAVIDLATDEAIYIVNDPDARQPAWRP